MLLLLRLENFAILRWREFFWKIKKCSRKIFAGKVNKGAISMLPNQSGLTGISTIIQSTKSDVSASLTEGLESNSSEIQKSSTDK